jgi:hypothetical protein
VTDDDEQEAVDQGTDHELAAAAALTQMGVVAEGAHGLGSPDDEVSEPEPDGSQGPVEEAPEPDGSQGPQGADEEIKLYTRVTKTELEACKQVAETLQRVCGEVTTEQASAFGINLNECDRLVNQAMLARRHLEDQHSALQQCQEPAEGQLEDAVCEFATALIEVQKAKESLSKPLVASRSSLIEGKDALPFREAEAHGQCHPAGRARTRVHDR